MRDTWPRLERIAFPPIRRGRLDTLQVNIGYRCNQTCVHCHVNAGPHRTEEMSRETLADVVAFIGISSIRNLDITDRKSTRLNSSHTVISYAVFCLKKKKQRKLIDSAS